MKQTTFFLIILFMTSCAMQSGRYVQKGGEWVFQPSEVGFMRLIQNPGRDNSAFDYRDSARFIWPVPSAKRISSFYGMRSGKHHDGIDIPARSGSHILAADRGKVVFSGRMRGYGRVIVIKHQGGYHTVYAHNRKNFASKGQRVSQGEVIAQVGSSGRSSGPHVHFEIRKNNKVRDPANYIHKVERYKLAGKR
ncbi:MAG: M23 family metallopeptidase [Bacteriovoracaceae bacterium]